jgi:hypothetical protein
VEQALTVVQVHAQSVRYVLRTVSLEFLAHQASIVQMKACLQLLLNVRKVIIVLVEPPVEPQQMVVQEIDAQQVITVEKAQNGQHHALLEHIQRTLETHNHHNANNVLQVKCAIFSELVLQSFHAQLDSTALPQVKFLTVHQLINVKKEAPRQHSA